MNKYNLPGLADACTWVGEWPFLPLRYNTPDLLREKLSEQGIVKALVSPLNAVFSQDPVESSKVVLNVDPDFFIPVPIVDLSRRNWTEAVSWLDQGIKVIKLLPNYHMYSLQDHIGKLVAETKKKNAVISVQVRMQDERGQYKLCKVQRADLEDLACVVKQYPDQKFLLNGMYLNEIKLFIDADNVRIGMSALESDDIYKTLTDRYSLDRFVFSTHTPLFFLEGNLFKIGFSGLSDHSLQWIGADNLLSFIG